ncbi:9204_t:CDS:2, partial [Acaulospora colombiana]
MLYTGSRTPETLWWTSAGLLSDVPSAQNRSKITRIFENYAGCFLAAHRCEISYGSPKLGIKSPYVEQQLNLPIEIVEIIIDNVPDGQTVAAANCDRVVPYLNGPSQAGQFVQSLVITKSASDILAHESIERAADALVRACPNIRELQMRGVTDWSIERFLDPLIEQLEDLTLADVSVNNWSVISQRLSKCTNRLKCLRISSVKFTNHKSVVLSKQSCTQNQGSSSPLENLERLAIESQCHGYSFAGMLLDQVIQSQASNLRAIELPFPMPSNGQQFLSTLGQNLTSLEIHCESFQAFSANDDLSQCRHLTHLHFKNIYAHLDYAGPALAILHPYVSDDWKALDDTLSMPHMASLQSLQLSGLFFIAGRVGNLL